MGKNNKKKTNQNSKENKKAQALKNLEEDKFLEEQISKVKFDDNVQIKNIESVSKSNKKKSNERTDKVKKSKTLCLNMIVKNESHIIKETLGCVYKYIDYWVICDTGSTDGTQQIIKDFFEEKGIPGELHQHEWKNFGHNRSLAFGCAYNKTDYVWVIDADDLVVGEIIFPDVWDKDFYFFKFGNDFTYERQQIFNNRLKWEYKGVLHEYPKCINKQNLTCGNMHNNFYIDSRRLGDRSKDPKKYLKDAETLVKGIEDEPDQAVRYTFYAAQSYKDYGDNENAIKYYKKRIEYGGWNEELYISWLEIGNALVRLRKDKKEIADAYLNGFKILPQRSETLYLLGEYYFNINDIDNAYKVSKLASNIKIPTEFKLFLQSDVYHWKLKELQYRIYVSIREVKLQIKNLTEDKINSEIDLLYKFLTTDSNVPDYAKQRIVKFTNSYKLTEITEIPEDYDFYPGLDSYGNDIGHFPNKTIEELSEISEFYDNCVGFNSYGYLKHTITEKDKFINLSPLLYKNDGLFVKKTKNLESEKDKNTISSIDRYIYYNNNKVDEITSRIKSSLINKKNKLTLTITTCKRYDLFEKTINSFINCCKDIELIDRFICIDDNSSDEDRFKMKELYPFFEYVLKTPEQKGHVESMNMIIDLVDSEYLLHLEDDWMFHEEYDYVTKAFEIFDQKHILPKEVLPDDFKIGTKEIAQVLFNKNYTEIQETTVQGGYKCTTSKGNEYLIHEYYDPNENKENYLKAISKYPNKGTCIYWPHYSFRPSIIKTKIFKELGKYSREHGFFEMEYAKRYVSKNYISVFFNKVVCRHTGKLTSEKNNDSKKNAYALNGVDQFGNSPNKVVEKGKIICINLEKRTDRKRSVQKEFEKTSIKNLEFYKGIYGKNVKPNKELADLFYGNDFGSRKGVIGCALSHLDLWTRLLESEQDYYLILEDDIKLTKDFDEKYKLIKDFIETNVNKIDFFFIGYHMFESDKKKFHNKYFDDSNTTLSIEGLNTNIYIGGFYSYIITKTGARKILKYIINNGIRHGIDYLLKVHNFTALESSPHIIFSDWVTQLDSSVDSDIQKDYQNMDLDFTNINKVEIDNNTLTDDYLKQHFRKIIDNVEFDDTWVFYKCNDSINGDIQCVGKKSVDELIKIANTKNNCIGFNTLGYLKSFIDLDKLINSPYFGPTDGIYVKKSHIDNYLLTNKKKDFYRVKLLCNWQDSKKLCDEWNNLTKGNYTWNKIKFTWEDTDIDYWVIINYPQEGALYINKKTIVFHMEPMCNNPDQNWGAKTWGKWSDPKPYDYLDVRTHKYHYNNATWQLKTTYNEFKNNSIVKSSELGNKISSICSSKYFDPGHKKRVDFIKYIEEKSDPDVQIDIWGFDNNLQFKNYKGACPVDNKDIGIVPYKYYLIAENNIEHNYISEKFWEPILSECLVFYYGSPNVSDYIDSRAFVQIDLTQDFDSVFEIVKNAIKNNLWEERLPYIKEAKNKILDYYNFCPTVERIIESSIDK
jgi:GR25 family glycosyltransferase involved in LPS biosynthesis